MPKKVGRYKLLAPIASGGMATVYLGRSTGVAGFSRIVAVKLLHPHLLEDAAQTATVEFIDEAKLSARLSHPLIVPVLDVGDSDNGFYLVMDYVDGASLGEVLKLANPLDHRIIGRILYDVLEALGAAHTATDEKGDPLGIVHRDFSPQNILVGTDGRSRLTDFGIARANTRAEYTRTGLIKGKIAYMSPEQAEDEELDHRTDVWAAGIVAWEALAGRRMYPKMDAMKQLLKIVGQEPPRLKEANPEISDALDTAVHSALAVEKDERCGSALVFRERLVEALGGPSEIATHAEVGKFIADLNIQRLDDLRAVVQEATKGGSIPPPGMESSGPDSGTTAPERPASMHDDEDVEARNESSGTFATSSAKGLDVSDSEPEESGPRFWLWGALALGGIAAAFALFAGEDPSEVVEKEPAVESPKAVANPEPSKADETPAPEPETKVRDEVELTASDTVVEVHVGKRAVVIRSPARGVTLALKSSEYEGELQIRALTEDGREAEGVLQDGESAINLEFPEKSAAPPPKKKPSRPRTSPKPRPKPKDLGLAPMPF